MSVFKDYAAYYDLLYKGKNYEAEAAYIHQTIQANFPGAKTILNLGCGTGNHDFLLACFGYEITSVDISAEMISIADQKRTNEKINFLVGDLRSLELNKKFDAVISLFHVMSYQVTNEDLKNSFSTVANHLIEGGVFIFDCWYGPGVLSDPPLVRYRVLENEELKIHRIAEPLLHPDDNYVDVNYTLLVNNKRSGLFYEVKETHKMRYFFQPEIMHWLSGLELKVSQQVDNVFSNAWNALFVCRK